VFRKRVPGVGSSNRKSSAADGSQSDWRHDQTVSSGRTQSSSTIVMFFYQITITNPHVYSLAIVVAAKMEINRNII